MYNNKVIFRNYDWALLDIYVYKAPYWEKDIVHRLRRLILLLWLKMDFNLNVW